MNSNSLVGIVERAQVIIDRAAASLDVGAQLDKLWADLRSASMTDLENNLTQIVTALALLGERGERISRWMLTHTDNSPAACHLLWLRIARESTALSAASA